MRTWISCALDTRLIVRGAQCTVHERASEFVHECVHERVCECVHERVCECVHERARELNSHLLEVFIRPVGCIVSIALCQRLIPESHQSGSE